MNRPPDNHDQLISQRRKSAVKGPGPSYSTALVGAVHEVADAIRKSQESRHSRRRVEFATQLMALGNIAAGALLFGQAFSGFRFDFQIALVGLIALVCLYGVALITMRGGEWK